MVDDDVAVASRNLPVLGGLLDELRGALYPREEPQVDLELLPQIRKLGVQNLVPRDFAQGEGVRGVAPVQRVQNDARAVVVEDAGA
eukprot:CAMPEP_0180540082 /NCGR_PEP_ID=MMETSP1036_2-20121128/67233_1 /TAXON_ID=632150 /ORGANISM="Azadinium spinosum, Strain 3D9" /LENGTH=85 /DNA_ID=CAMNT_0022554867 /DNA_START=177 /DNA_END=431 /DNA_ORIENTATION=+